MTDQEFFVEKVDVTARIAGQFLQRNAEKQRNVRPARVEQYARDMLASRWFLTGDGIRFDTNDVMLDGQHRALAVLEAAKINPDIVVPMLVFRNIDPTVMPVLDTNIPRGLHDMMGILLNAPNNHLMAATVRRVLQWESGNYMGTTGRNGGVPTHLEALERLNKDVEGFTASAARGRDVQNARIAPGAPSATAFYLFRQIDKEKSHQFFDGLISGANLPETSPILFLRNRLARANRLRGHEYLALYIRAWNPWREDRVIGHLMVDTSRGKLSNANFPKPK